MSSRREFIAGISLLGLSGPLGCQILNDVSGNAFWDEVQALFKSNPDGLLNLNHGSSTNMPIPIMEKYVNYTEAINAYAPYQILNSWKKAIATAKSDLSNFIGADNSEISYTLNTTTAINSILEGLPLESGDEIVCASSDYPHSTSTLENIKRIKGVNLIKLDIDFINLTDEEIVETYKKAISPKTKLLFITHITHRKGEIYPVQMICDMARAKGVDTLIDGAHSVGQIDLNLHEIGCDYFASSLHKWLNAPLGTGIRYIKSDKIGKVNHIGSYPKNKIDNNEKFDYIGTRAFQNELVVKDCLEFVQEITIKKKESRFCQLKDHWVNQLKDHPEIEILSDQKRSGGISSLWLPKLNTKAVINTLSNKYKIHVKASSNNLTKRPLMRISPVGNSTATRDSWRSYF